MQEISSISKTARRSCASCFKVQQSIRTDSTYAIICKYFSNIFVCSPPSIVTYPLTTTSRSGIVLFPFICQFSSNGEEASCYEMTNNCSLELKWRHSVPRFDQLNACLLQPPFLYYTPKTFQFEMVALNVHIYIFLYFRFFFFY